uniref:Essential MCU regulator, mitochondrial n=1 Tax=Myotis lucifugus TaxID=59463 RepID=G1Q422_MYOLU
MASAAARRLVLASVHHGALRRGPSLKKDGDIAAGRGGAGRSLAPSRSVITTRSGAILPKPVRTPFGLLRVLCTVIPFLYVGTLISKNIAALLEEHDISVPEDDDDDL